MGWEGRGLSARPVLGLSPCPVAISAYLAQIDPDSPGKDPIVLIETSDDSKSDVFFPTEAQGKGNLAVQNPQKSQICGDNRAILGENAVLELFKW